VTKAIDDLRMGFTKMIFDLILWENTEFGDWNIK